MNNKLLLSVKLRKYLTCLSMLLVLLSSSVSADWVLSAPPRESVEDGDKYYAPIASYLSKVLGEKVVYKHPVDWMSYSLNMRKGIYDIVFDGPHFAAWRTKNVGHVPVVRLKGSLVFYILAKKDDLQAKDMRSIIGRPLCGLASPNLGTVSAFAIYDNPIIQPDMKIIQGGMRTVMKKFLSGECRYAVVRDKLYKKLPAEKKKLIKIVAKSPAMPNQSITVSTKISKKNRKAIVKAFTSAEGALAADALLSRFSKKKKHFIATNKKEFKELELLLEGVVWGW